MTHKVFDSRRCRLLRATSFGAFFAAAAAITLPLYAQAGGTPPGQVAKPSFGDIVAGADWLQANALPLDRDALQSMAFGVSLRRTSWAVDAGWLRIARTLSTVQGATLSAGPLVRWKQVLFRPTLGVLAGKASASSDTSGYDYVGAQGAGHQPRYGYSSAGSAGGGVGLTVEVPVYRTLAVRTSASQWYFSGAPLEGDRTRTLVGAGLSLRVWQ